MFLDMIFVLLSRNVREDSKFCVDVEGCIDAFDIVDVFLDNLFLS